MTVENAKQKLGIKLGVGDWITIVTLVLGAAFFNERRFAAMERDNAVQQKTIDLQVAEVDSMKASASILSRIEQHLTEIDRRLERLEGQQGNTKP